VWPLPQPPAQGGPAAPQNRVGVTLLAELEAFVGDHRPHGALTSDATESAWNGYLLTVACSCGVVFERWITPWDAELDLLRAATLNWTFTQRYPEAQDFSRAR
jgi:hypothetical protein